MIECGYCASCTQLGSGHRRKNEYWTRPEHCVHRQSPRYRLSSKVSSWLSTGSWTAVSGARIRERSQLSQIPSNTKSSKPIHLSVGRADSVFSHQATKIPSILLLPRDRHSGWDPRIQSFRDGKLKQTRSRRGSSEPRQRWCKQQALEVPAICRPWHLDSSFQAGMTTDCLVCSRSLVTAGKVPGWGPCCRQLCTLCTSVLLLTGGTVLTGTLSTTQGTEPLVVSRLSSVETRY